MTKIHAIFIGASAGGVTAILKILDILPSDYPLPIIITQHLPRDSQIQAASVFEKKRKSRVFEAIDKMPIESNHVYFAPPDYHLLIEKDFVFSLSQDELVNYSRPSIDVMFESAALAFGASACGVLLTGGNEDGARGLAVMQKAGGLALVQDPKDAECAAMPQSALAIMQPTFVGKLDEIASQLLSLAEVSQ